MSTGNLLRFSLIVSHQISAVGKNTVPAFRYKSSNLHTVYNQSATTHKKRTKKTGKLHFLLQELQNNQFLTEEKKGGCDIWATRKKMWRQDKSISAASKYQISSVPAMQQFVFSEVKMKDYW